MGSVELIECRCVCVRVDELVCLEMYVLHVIVDMCMGLSGIEGSWVDIHCRLLIMI